MHFSSALRTVLDGSYSTISTLVTSTYKFFAAVVALMHPDFFADDIFCFRRDL